MSTYDYIVVGAGSAGCVVAARLSEDENVRVLLLEAGGQDELQDIHVPPAWPTLWGTEVDWDYSTMPQHGTAGLVHKWPRGKVLGGSSSINAMVYLRGHRHDFDAWERAGAQGWGYRDVLPYFRLLLGIERARELNATNAFAPWRKGEVLPGDDVRDEAGLRAFIARGTGTYYHPVGSCKLGIDGQAVVDPELKVHGLEGLRVADASIMPSIVCVNTNPTAIMIGEKAADLIHGTHNRRVSDI